MTAHGFRRPAAVITATVLILGAAGPVAALDPDTAFYVARPNHGAIEQIADLRSSGQHDDAALIRELIRTPTAEWYTQGTPKRVMQDVRNDVNRAADKGVIPVLVAYNIPFRDCAQFSAGGATTIEEYEAWIDGFAAGIGDRPALVILEPDGLGIIPWYNPFADRDTWVPPGTLEWCQPAEADAATAASDRFAMLNYAVDTLTARPNARVYLDGTHSAWLGSGDAADRLIQAGVADADGFFVNVSNYRLDAHLAKYGTWTAKCIAFASNPASWGVGHSEWCGSQYSPANPNDFSTWGLTDQWYTDNVESQTWWYAESLLEHFVVDSSRNGQGPWTPPPYPDPQDWCNPPGRGLGVRPTADTGNALIDAYLWIKVPGESDGECTRGLGPGGTTVDPEWGRIDPSAGAWFPEQALELAELAVPAFGD